MFMWSYKIETQLKINELRIFHFAFGISFFILIYVDVDFVITLKRVCCNSFLQG